MSVLRYVLGSTNTVLRSIHGTEDIETAAIHIALGLDVGVDVMGVHDSSTKRFLRYTVSLLGYGFHGDIISTSERMRFLGPFRYDVAGAWEWLKSASYRARIAYLPSDSSTPFDGDTCCTTCPVCMKTDVEHEEAGKTSAALDQPPTWGEPSEVETSTTNVDLFTEMSGSKELPCNTGRKDVELPGGWRVTSGEFLAVNAFLISCRCAKSPLGPAPSAHLGNGLLDLIMVRRCSRWQYLSYLAHLTNRRRDRQTRHLRMPFVEAHRIRAFRFQALDNDGDPIDSEKSFARNLSVWNVDGEILTNPNLICCVHRQLIRMYGRGPET